MNHYKFIRPISILIALALLLSPLVQQKVAASVLVDDVTLPAIDGSGYTAQNDGDIAYVEATNTFYDGNPNYVLVTQDTTKTLANTPTVTYKGASYTLTKVVLTSNIAALPNGIINGNALPGDTTYFFDSGTFNDSDATAYTRFSSPNLSLVGLYKDNNGEPTTILTKSTRTGTGIESTIERYNLAQQNIYLENLIFDGQTHDMYPVGQGSGTGQIRKNRGEYMFYLTGGDISPYLATEGFVMRDCIVQNVGASNEDTGYSSSAYNKNVAMNFYSSLGQHNIEDVIFRNIKTTNTYGIISSNQSNHNYFKNITIKGDGANTNSYSIKIENNSTNIPLTDNWAVFAGNLSLPIGDYQHNHIYIQDYRYHQVHTPANFRYARYYSSNGSTSSSAIRVYQDIIPAVGANTATMDLNDNAWLVRAANARSVSDQLTDINSVRNGGLASVVAARPNPNIKIAANTSGQIPSFNTPDYGASANLVAIASETGLFSERALIPLAEDASITLNATNAPTTKLYNIDFHSLAKLTMHEAINGINPAALTPQDPNEGSAITGYPFYSTYKPTSVVPARVVNSTVETYVNDRFTSLASAVSITNPPTGPLTPNSQAKLSAALAGTLPVGGTLTLTAELTGAYTWSAYTAPVVSVDDPTINWFSTNPDVASIDQTTGQLTGVSAGTAQICAKAMDANNNGEIEKPWQCIEVSVDAVFYVTYDGNGNTGGTAPVDAVAYTVGIPATILPPADLVKDGWAFVGWNSASDGSGTAYAPGESILLESDLKLFAIWAANTPTPTRIPPTATPTRVPPTSTPSPTATLAPTATKAPAKLPDSGFPMGKVSLITSQRPAASQGSDLTLTVSRLGIELDIVNVPQENGNWDVSWLSDSEAGHMEGSAFPTLKGNSVLTAHVWNAYNQPGPFHDLKDLRYNDEVKIEAFGHVYTFAVRNNLVIAPENLKSAFAQKDGTWLTLMTCEDYNSKTETYALRRLVRAVLVKVD